MGSPGCSLISRAAAIQIQTETRPPRRTRCCRAGALTTNSLNAIGSPSTRAKVISAVTPTDPVPAVQHEDLEAICALDHRVDGAKTPRQFDLDHAQEGEEASN
jgi:hypothetical protein